jgi:hypothetical protein
MLHPEVIAFFDLKSQNKNCFSGLAPNPDLAVPVSIPTLGNTKNLLCGVGVVYLYPYSLKSSSLKTTHSTPNPPQTAATTPPIHAELGALSGTGAGVGVEVEVAIGVATKSGMELKIGRKASLF